MDVALLLLLRLLLFEAVSLALSSLLFTCATNGGCDLFLSVEMTVLTVLESIQQASFLFATL